MKLSGKVAIVTGSASGMGRAMVMLMAREGAAVWLSTSRVNPKDWLASENLRLATCVKGEK